jgi:glycine cleavage system H protein
MNAPAEARFIESHEYVVPHDGTATIGISPYAVEQLGDVVYVELPAVGAKLSKGKTFGVVESVKAVSDLYAPIDGEVLEINQTLIDDPAAISTDAFAQGWMIKIKPSNESQLTASDMMTLAKYTEFIGNH